jgi:hypothetical protein
VQNKSITKLIHLIQHMVMLANNQIINYERPVWKDGRENSRASELQGEDVLEIDVQKSTSFGNGTRDYWGKDLDADEGMVQICLGEVLKYR